MLIIIIFSPVTSQQYEFKVKGIRKIRCTLDVSTTGVKVSKRKRKRVSNRVAHCTELK